MIRVENLSKSYGSIQVLKGINLEIGAGEMISVVGASGAGKTTLLQLIGTLDKPTNGAVMIDDVNVFSLSERKMAAYRNRHIGFIFQFHQLLPEFNVLENTCLPAFIAGTSKTTAFERAKELLDYLGLAEKVERKPAELSGGEQQRVAVARALINRPKIILADEPSGNLDSANAQELHELFANLRSEFNQTFVIVTHNATLADMADRKFTISDGILN